MRCWKPRLLSVLGRGSREGILEEILKMRSDEPANKIWRKNCSCSMHKDIEVWEIKNLSSLEHKVQGEK